MPHPSSPRPTPHRFRRRLAAVLAGALAAAGLALAAPSVQSAPAAAASEPLGGYLFAYFTGEGSANGEQVYFAVSRGNDPLKYDVLNQGRPALVSTVGTGGVRDPHVLRKQDGTFVMIATDLRIYGNGAWDASQRTGSRSIVVWESSDLVTWSAPRLQQVADSTAGNVWAPESYYDKARGTYVVFWASKIYSTNDPQHTGNVHNRMLYATTNDFKTFSAPQTWNDPGYSVIDSTVIEENGTYYRFTKDERDNNSSSPCGKFVSQERSTSLTSTSYTNQTTCLGKGSLGAAEGPLVFKSNTENRWYLMLDEFSGRGYVPLTTTDLASGRWTEAPGAELPASPRHGTVLPITTTELNRLTGASNRISTTTGKRSFQAVTSGYTDRWWRHENYLGVNAQTTSSSSSTQKQDSTWNVVAGLAGSGCYSFESVNFPGRYLRHYDYRLRLDANDGSGVFAGDATFCATTGKTGQGVSWRSYNVPTRFIRHYGNVLYAAADGGSRSFDSTNGFAADATWLNQAPWS